MTNEGTRICCCLLALATGGCWSAARIDERPLVVVASGDTAGWIVPCGCTANQSGGLLRRGAYLEELRDKDDAIYVDVGGAPGGTTPYDRAKFAAILRGEREMNVTAHNLGLAEAQLGADVLRELSQSTGIRWLSANVQSRDGKPLGEPIVLETRGGKRLALVGVLDDAVPIAGLEILPPREAILAALASAKGKYDTAVVLAYLPEEPLTELASNLPEVDVVIGGPTGQSIAPRRIGPTLLLSATNKGKFLARLMATGGKPLQWQGEIVELTPTWSDSPRQQQNLDHFRSELATRDFAPQDTSFARADDGHARIAGIERCQECHAKEHTTWDMSLHSAAWKSLTGVGAHVDPLCQHCHTMGYGQSGGFRSLTDAESLKSVGCESCHGPSLAHAEDAKRSTAYAGQSADQCLHCHDRENSPQFNYEVYWKRIQHGKKP